MNRNLVIFCIAVLASCHPPEKSGQNVFRYNESKGIPTLDPAYARNQTIIWPVNQLYNGLVQLDQNLNVVPCIALRWELSDDGLVYTFHLRKDVRFHDHELFVSGKGRQVVAEDFVYSLARISDRKVASPGAWIFDKLDRNGISRNTGFFAPDDSTLNIYLKAPFPAFPGILSMPYCFAVPREIVEHYGNNFRSNPVGTGPFLLKLWKEDEKLVLVRNPDYFETDHSGQRLPYLDAISISFIRDKQSEFMEFMMGRLDFLSGMHPVYKDELVTRNGDLNPKYHDRFNMLTEPYLNTEYLGFLLDPQMDAVKDSPVLDIKVRKAINHGFDRIKMMKYLRNNIGTPALDGFVPPGLPSSLPGEITGYDYNPDLSRQLLAEAGFPGGLLLPEITLTSTADYLDLCEFIQHELAEIGIKISIEINSGASFRNRMANGQLSFFRGSWIADYPDAENYLSLFYSRNFSPGGPNYTHFSRPEFDSLFQKAMIIPSDSERYAVYRSLDQLIMDNATIVPLYYDQVVRFIPKGLMGLQTNAMNLLVLKAAYWEN